MDLLSHFTIPYLTLWLLRRPHRERLAAGIGGVAPDIDTLTTPLAEVWPVLYPIGHRGITHTVWGAPLAALLLVLVLRIPWWSHKWPRMRALRLEPRLAAIALLFAYSHLLLDGITLWGIPALYPWIWDRLALRWTFLGIMLVIPVSGYLVWRVARGSVSTVMLKRVAVVLVVVLAGTAAIRVATFPGEPADGVTQPAPFDWQWITMAPTPEGWEATYWSWGEAVGRERYVAMPPRSAAAEDALETAKDSVYYHSFRFQSGGPVVVQVVPRGQDGWTVTFLDLMFRTEADRSPWSKVVLADSGLLKLAVEGDDVRLLRE